MSSAFVPTFTNELTHRGKREAWRLANNVVTTLLVATAMVARRNDLRAAAGRRLRERLLDDPGKLDSTVTARADHAAVSAARRRRGGDDGHAELAHHYFVPALSPAMFNVASIRLRDRARPAHAARRSAADHGHRVRRMLGGIGQWWCSGGHCEGKASSTGRC
jgi:hypothetical protein